MANLVSLNKGLLWFDDNDNERLEIRIGRAIEYFTLKHGEKPRCCYVHPSMLDEKEKDCSNITIRTSSYVIPHHFWLEFQN